MGPGSGARLDRPVSTGHSALLCLWLIVEGHGARVWCQTGHASWHGPLCLVMLMAYCRGPWGQGPVPDWTGQLAWATLPCCYSPEHCSRGTLQGTLAVHMAHGDLMGNKGQLYMPAIASLSTFGQDTEVEGTCELRRECEDT